MELKMVKCNCCGLAKVIEGHPCRVCGVRNISEEEWIALETRMDNFLEELNK